MNQREAIEALGKWMYRDEIGKVDEYARSHYLSMVQANVAAGRAANFEGPIVEEALYLTHATIKALVAGEKE